MLGVSDWLTSRIGTRSGPTYTLRELGSGWMAALSTCAVAARNLGLAFMASFLRRDYPHQVRRVSLTRPDRSGPPNAKATIIIRWPMNLEQARTNMVEQQIRTWEVLDQDILDLLYLVPREEFVPQTHRELDFSELDIHNTAGV